MPLLCVQRPNRNYTKAIPVLRQLMKNLGTEYELEKRIITLVYPIALVNKLTLSFNISIVISSCYYLTCQERGILVTASKIVKEIDCKRSTFFKCYRKLHVVIPTKNYFHGNEIAWIGFIWRSLLEKKKIKHPKKIYKNTTTWDTITYSDFLYSRATRSCKELHDFPNNKKPTPLGLASTAVYYTCIKYGEKVTMKDIQDITNVARSTMKRNKTILTLF